MRANQIEGHPVIDHKLASGADRASDAVLGAGSQYDSRRAKQAGVDTIPRSHEVQVVRWQRHDGQPHQQTFRNRTLALRKAERLRDAGLHVAVYSAAVSRWEAVPVLA